MATEVTLALLIAPDESARFTPTFADDHYLPDLRKEHVKVVAQVPGWADVRWYHDLVRKHRNEVKSRWVVENWNSLGVDLRNAAERCIREALIIISDSTLHKLEIVSMLETRVMKRPFKSLPDEAREHMEAVVNDYVEREVLADSPAYDALKYVAGSTPDLSKLRNKFGNGHNVRIFAARITAALVEYVDPNRRSALEDYIRDRRYWTASELTGLFMAEALGPHRTFDEGNTKVVKYISDILRDVAERIRRSEYLVLPSGAGTVVEADSAKTPHVAVADIAAGIAGKAYRSSAGLRGVVERFRMVILNGAVVKL